MKLPEYNADIRSFVNRLLSQANCHEQDCPFFLGLRRGGNAHLLSTYYAPAPVLSGVHGAWHTIGA